MMVPFYARLAVRMRMSTIVAVRLETHGLHHVAVLVRAAVLVPGHSGRIVLKVMPRSVSCHVEVRRSPYVQIYRR